MSGTRSIESRQLYRAVPDAVTELGPEEDDSPMPHMLPAPPKSSETRAIILLISRNSEHVQVWPDDVFTEQAESQIEAPVSSRQAQNETPPMGWAGAFEKAAARRAFGADPQTQMNDKSGLRGSVSERRNIHA